MSSRAVKKSASSASTPPTPPASSKSAQKAPRASRSLPSARNNNFDSDFDAQEVLIGLLEASYFLAVLTDGEGTPVYPPPPAYVLQPPAELTGPYLRLLNTVLANLRVARVRLSAVSEEESLEAHVLSPDRAATAANSFPLVVPTPIASPASAVVFSAAKSSRSDVRPQRALFPDAQSGDKLAKSTLALRLTRQALRQLECVERQAELARSAIAGQRIAHHALRDYRTKANRHVAVANGELRALIQRTSTLEDLDPEVPGRNSPAPQIPSTLGDLPALAAVEEAAAIDIRRFSQEDFTHPPPPKTSERAKRAAALAPSPTARADKRPASPESPPPEPGRAPARRKRAK
jgi:hypothetical protein